jgi:hypothetical protein
MQHRSYFATPLGDLKFKFANGGKIKKSFNHPRSLYLTRPIKPNHFQADLIWCDSTFRSFSLPVQNLNKIQFLKLWLQQSERQPVYFFHLPCFVVGSGVEKNPDPGQTSRICNETLSPEHLKFVFRNFTGFFNGKFRIKTIIFSLKKFKF